jgi:hypothetical protein
MNRHIILIYNNNYRFCGADPRIDPRLATPIRDRSSGKSDRQSDGLFR